MRRRLVLIAGGGAVALVLAAAGLVALLLASAPGHAFVRDYAVRALERALNGRVQIGSVGGSLWRLADIRDVTLATPDGRPVLRVARVRVRYAWLDLLRGRFVLHRVELIRPTVVLEQAPDGTWNYRRLLRLDEPRVGPPGRRPLVELVDAQVTDATVVLRPKADAQGVRAERHFLGVRLDLRRLRVSHPDSTAIVASVRWLALRSTEPPVEVVRADGDVSVDGDSVRFDFDHFELPGTRASAAGRVRWGGDGERVSYDVALNARHLGFADVAWLDRRLPRDGGGSVVLRARAFASGATEVDARDFAVTTGRSTVSGAARLTIGPRGGVRIAAMDLAFAPLDLALLRPLVEALPVRGLVRGRLRGAGTPADLAVDASLAFTDEAVAGSPTSTLAGSGHLALGGAEGLVFRAFVASRADADLGTVRRLAPVVSLRGRVRLAGRLDGPWKDVAFAGVLTHDAGAQPLSTARGTVRLATRDTVRVDADLVLDSLSFDALAASYPAIPLQGMVAGPVTLRGPVTALAFTAALAGPAGRIEARGMVGARDSAVSVRAEGTFAGVDLRRHQAAAPPTSLAGRWSADLVVPLGDSTAPTLGRVRLTLDSSRLAGSLVRRAALVIRLTPDRFAVDTAYLLHEGGDAEASGALGRPGRPAAQLTFAFRADTLGRFVSLLHWLMPTTGDSTAAAALEGRGQAHGRLVGTTDEWEADGSVDAERVRYGSYSATELSVSGRVTHGGRADTLDVHLAADSLAFFGYRYGPVEIAAGGPTDRLALRVIAGFRLGSSVRATARLARDSLGMTAWLDSLELTLPASSWRLAAASRIVVTRDSLAIDSLELRAEHGLGRLRAEGSFPLAGVGDFVLHADSVPLADAYAIAQRDTVGVGGSLVLNVHVAGPGASPAMEIQASLDNGRFGEFRAPRLEVLGRYVDRRLWFKGGLWRDSTRVVGARGSLPIDLALTDVARRQLPDSLQIAISSDSVDLAVVDALTSLVTRVGGQVSVDAAIGGTWEEPRLAGRLTVRNGAVTVPGLGTRYTGITARLELENNRIQVAEARFRSGGTLDVSGEVRFESLTRPVLDLTLEPRGFAAYRIRDLGTMTASGVLRLRGPGLGATLGGRLTVDAGTLAFADLVEKRIVNLDDPEFRAIVDSNLARAADLGPTVQSVFLDSLRILGLIVTMGPDMWLRSHEANIQLSGELQVEKAVEGGIPRYRLDGTLNAVRGTYRLILPPATSKEFQVVRGTVRFFGTPDFNPELDIAAQHTLRTLQGSQLVVRAIIGGTLLLPRLTLESDERPPLSETELVSYLLFGRPSADLVAAGTGTRNETAILQGTLASLAAGELEQTLVGGLGLPLDYLAIRPAGMPGDAQGLSATRVEAGAQIGERTFLILNAGLCEVRRGATSQILGASVEYRLSQRFKFEASIEPLVRECRVTGPTTPQSSRYQIGVDLFFQPGQH